MSGPRVFVSHSHEDNSYCRDYVKGLRARGATVWYDEHNLGWGELRATIEREMPQSQHFVAILSPAAVVSKWVNREIDAAIRLFDAGKLRTVNFVVAKRCVVPLLLDGWKRIEGPGGAEVSVPEAVSRTAANLDLRSDAPIETPVAQPIAPPLAQSDSAQVRSVATTVHGRPPAPIADEPLPKWLDEVYSSARIPGISLLPARLAQLDFVGHRQDGAEIIVPPLAAVPAGEFLMGSDPARDNEADDREMPQHRVTLATYQIARYPVTVVEYACCVRAGQRPAPSEWDQQMQRLDHPVVNVSWHDAVAYAAWLAKLTGAPWRLPTEPEWEKAARGRDGRVYPWGNTWDRARANTNDGGPGTTTPVGTYADRGDASPYGVHDLAGNVWEWTSSALPLPGWRWSRASDSTGNRALRGGSWFDHPRLARAAYRPRDLFWSAGSSVFNGFRVVCAVPSS